MNSKLRWLLGTVIFHLVVKVLFTLALVGAYPDNEFINSLSSLGALIMWLGIQLGCVGGSAHD